MKNYLRLAVFTAGLTVAVGSASAADLKFGLAASLTGPGAQYGASIRNGFELAVEEINSAGGVKGNKIVAVIDDDQGKKEEGINTFKKLIFQDNVLAIFGPTFSNVAVAADAIAQASRVVAFGTSTTADGITATGDFIFRNAVTEADVLPETIRVAAQKVGLKKVAVFYGSDDVLTKSGYDNFKKALDDLKVPVTTTETFAKGDVDFKAQLTKIAATKPDAIVLSALIAEGAPIMVQARQLGINVPFIGGNGMNSVKIFELANEKAENLWVGSPWSFENASEENKQFIAKYKKKFGGNAPDQFAAQAYDALFIVCEAAKKVNFSGTVAVDRVAIRNALPAVTWKGATGAFKFKQAFDRAGKPAGFDAEQRAIVSVTRQGRFVLQN
ncbi:ABC transporter substrate-binding protein [Rhizobacter sp. Root404]|uniref:ABC transporter substrate-binding protein n=1 Tax=Rhizobacter sp. Root404 TaxID=1736528 RepID=UPI0007000B51|nr:ABC transporter substrate-binding protein [Rhizobacter sp. Root404]KQW38396.1 ABC transporter substrate-binding protein [Rhizobacter sp. Root404]